MKTGINLDDKSHRLCSLGFCALSLYARGQLKQLNNRGIIFLCVVCYAISSIGTNSLHILIIKMCRGCQGVHVTIFVLHRL